MEVGQYGMSAEEVAYWNKIKKLNARGINKILYEDARVLFFKIIKEEIKKEVKPVYDFTENNIPVIQNMVKYFINDPSGKYDLQKGIWLFSDGYGHGKSYLFKLFQIFCNIIGLNQFEILYCKEFVTEMSIKSNYAELQNYVLTPCCFDDMMAEQKTKNFGSFLDSLDYCLTTRWRKKIKTHATSNPSPDELSTKYDKAIESRAYQLFNFQFLDSTKDYRNW